MSLTRTRARLLLFLIPLAAALTVRAIRAFSTPLVLDWDETYYLSLAVTGASGAGLYPYIYGFAPMRVMGGIGYAAYTYVLAVRAVGQTIFALRGVSLAVSVAGLWGIWVAVRSWYGSAAAWIAVAITASLRLFLLSNTARMDSWAFAWAAWGIAAVAVAFARGRDPRWHFLAGLAFGLGPQVHIDTLATAAACALLYIVRHVEDARAARRAWTFRDPAVLFAAGLAAGLVVYVAFNVLPDPASYYTMTVRVRLDATKAYSTGASTVFGSFLDPRVLAAKELLRYRQLWSITPWFELVMLGAAIIACGVRRTTSDKQVLTLMVGVAVAAAVLLNNASPLYYIHVLPALVIPIGPLFSHGFARHSRIALADVGRRALAVAALVVVGLTISAGVSTLRAIRATPSAADAPGDIQRVKSLVDRRCIIAGDGALYVPYLAAYPWFISVRPTEVSLAMLYYRTSDETAYWRIKQPDVVFSREPLRPALASYVSARRLDMESPGLWMNPAGCRPGP